MSRGIDCVYEVETLVRAKRAFGRIARMGAVGIAASCVMACTAPTDEANDTSSAAASTAFPNDKTAYDYFVGKGFTNFQAAAIVGNLDQESGINPTISQENGGPGRGIAQWSAGGRWDSDPGDNAVAYAASVGQSVSALKTQLDFIWYELTTYSQYGLTKLRSSTTLAAATTDFEIDFEGCGIPSQCDAGSRLSYATSVFNALGGTPPPPPPPADAGSTPSSGIHPHASSSLCLAVAGGATANGSAVTVANCDGSASQKWAFQGGTLRVYGTKCLDVPSGNTTDGTKLQIWDCATGNTNQTWTQSGAAIQWTGKGKCLDLTDGHAAAGTLAQQWACGTGNLNQSWSISQ